MMKQDDIRTYQLPLEESFQRAAKSQLAGRTLSAVDAEDAVEERKGRQLMPSDRPVGGCDE